MTLFPLMECSQLLAIDPKTLRHWVEQAHLSLHASPADGRRKCLTHEQLQQLAVLHARVLTLEEPHPTTSGVTLPFPQIQQEQTHPEVARTAASVTTMPTLLQEPADLVQKLSFLEAKMTTLEELLAQLALELVQERRLRRDERPQVSLYQEPDAGHLALQGTATPDGTLAQGRRLHPAEIRARARVLPLIEYGAHGSYVVICPLAGELSLISDSPEWFDWLARLSSFRFVGKQGFFTAYRKGTQRKPSRTWSAQFYFHQHHYRSYLGVTDHLTIETLERAAAQLQSSLPSLS